MNKAAKEYACEGQMTLEDFGVKVWKRKTAAQHMAERREERKKALIGEYFHIHGEEIPISASWAYIGQLVMVDVHTESQQDLVIVGKVMASFPNQFNNGLHRCVVFDGKSRLLLDDYKGVHIYRLPEGMIP